MRNSIPVSWKSIQCFRIFLEEIYIHTSTVKYKTIFCKVQSNKYNSDKIGMRISINILHLFKLNNFYMFHCMKEYNMFPFWRSLLSSGKIAIKQRFLHCKWIDDLVNNEGETEDMRGRVIIRLPFELAIKGFWGLSKAVLKQSSLLRFGRGLVLYSMIYNIKNDYSKNTKV